ncbi:hypothetical protein [Phormidesmis sp. 146-33]
MEKTRTLACRSRDCTIAEGKSTVTLETQQKAETLLKPRKTTDLQLATTKNQPNSANLKAARYVQ